MALVNELSPKVGISAACRELEVPRSWYYLQRAGKLTAGRKLGQRPRLIPKVGLDEAEKAQVRDVMNSERFMDLAPREIYATLLDEGKYLCHWRTMYRILAAYNEGRERRNQRQHPQNAKPRLQAGGPNELWSWDITALKGPRPRRFYYLYVILDVYSRFVVGWMAAQGESSELAKTLIAAACNKQNIHKGKLTLHADRGSPMRAKTVAELLADLGVTKTHTRPYTPDDNPYSEAQFKTMKYRPDYPHQFDSLDHARSWARTFFAWYNHEHHHTSLGLMTPAVVHSQQVDKIRASRQRVLDEAYAAHPERFVKGRPLAPKVPDQVWINPPQSADDADVTSKMQSVVQNVSMVSLTGCHEFGEPPVVNEMRPPPGEDKCSLSSINELSQIA